LAPSDKTAHDGLVRTSPLLISGLATVLVVSCSGATDTPPATTAPTAPPTSTATVAPTSAGTQQWPMPDLVGSVLQDAQDEIQTVTDGNVLISTSHDATGQHRNQVLDRNWRVCTQNVPAGDPITRDTLIDLGAVKLDESCP
jgi:hypothetical protein